MMKPVQLHLHVKTSNSKKLYSALQQISGINEIDSGSVPAELECSLVLDADPTILAVTKSSENWYCIRHNSFKKLFEWGEYLSSELDTLFVQISFRSEDGFSYLLAYEKGKRIREIEGVGSTETPVTNEGELFSFENPFADGISGKDLQMFDLDSLYDYCLELGVDLDNLQCSYTCRILRKDK
ncbi:hypothetical protein [Filimonas effusa]|uniref:Uncharacterized protein n=1 Tax=Filimonas effusa TaxID=2508721 RepID=A0A4Q1DDG1_9BACT|nr:hypothetical protein [Filimonas effusa]RXK87008.1 hypothetical protein ESB13_09560 [Filimonas effusa]